MEQNCKKIEALLGAYIEDRLSPQEKLLVETHLASCEICYSKFLTMKSVMQNLRFEYEKLLNEFEKIEAERIFNIREHESFSSNISSYLDDELTYDDCIKFRTYLLKSKNARSELSQAYSLKNNIQNSMAEIKNGLKINYEKSIIKKLKSEESNNSKPQYYTRAAILIGVMVLSLFVLVGIFSYEYLYTNTHEEFNPSVIETVEIPLDENFSEFSFDEERNAKLDVN